MCLIYLFADVTGYAYDMLNALGIVVLVLLWKIRFCYRIPDLCFP